MNYYDFHIGDYTSRTAHLEPMEDLAYRRLLDLYYMREGALPADVREVARLARLRGMEELVGAVLAEFFDLIDGGWFNAKCESVIAKVRAAAERAKHNGTKGGRPSKPKANPEKTQTVISENPDETQRVNFGNPEITNSQAPTSHFPLPINSVAIATDGDAVATKAELWAAGKSLLAEQGMPERQCGTFVGKLVKDYGDVVVVEAVRAAVVSRPADAAEYIKAACQHSVGQRRKPPPAEPAWRTEQRLRTQQAAPGVAAGAPAAQFFIDAESRVIPAIGVTQ